MKRKIKNEKVQSRRQFIGKTLGLTVGLAAGTKSVFAAPAFIRNPGSRESVIQGVKIGVITYSFRSMPDQSAEATLKYVQDSDINAVELMGDPAESYAGKPESSIDRMAFYMAMRKERNGEAMSETEKKELASMRAEMENYNKKVAAWRSSVSMDKFVKLRKMYNDADVQIYAFKPSAFGKDNTDAEINYGFRAAKALGASHVTLEHPGDDTWTKKLGDMGARHKIYVAYHGHLQQTPTMWDTALAQSRYNAMNLDFGHFVAAGNPHPLDIVRSKHDRIMSMHLKDRQTREHGQGNLPWGQGDTPIREVLQLIRDQNYSFPATIELEYEIPDGSDAVREVRKCMEYSRKALEA